MKARFRPGFLMPAIIRQPSPTRALTNRRNTTRGHAMQAFQENLVALGALLKQTNAARGEFSTRTTRPMPRSNIQFQVISESDSCYQVVELTTRAVRDTFTTYKAAMNFAQRLEAKDNLRLVQ
jgi:hypothetical protein